MCFNQFCCYLRNVSQTAQEKKMPILGDCFKSSRWKVNATSLQICHSTEYYQLNAIFELVILPQCSHEAIHRWDILKSSLSLSVSHDVVNCGYSKVLARKMHGALELWQLFVHDDVSNN